MMPKETTVRRIGNSAGLIIPKELLEHHHLAEGDTVHLIETERGLFITPRDPDFEDAMRLYEEGAKSYREALHELA